VEGVAPLPFTRLFGTGGRRSYALASAARLVALIALAVALLK
jgi:hypothetical protein